MSCLSNQLSTSQLDSQVPMTWPHVISPSSYSTCRLVVNRDNHFLAGITTCIQRLFLWKSCFYLYFMHVFQCDFGHSRLSYRWLGLFQIQRIMLCILCIWNITSNDSKGDLNKGCLRDFGSISFIKLSRLKFLSNNNFPLHLCYFPPTATFHCICVIFPQQ